jgi:hypothetical protein
MTFDGISVVWPTCRIGGLDLLAESIGAQVDPPIFEVILVDALHDYRAGRFGFPFDTKHVKPHGRVSWPHYAVCAARNTGIRASSGHTVLITVDWALASSRWLQRLYAAVQDDPGAVWVGAHPHKTFAKMDLPVSNSFKDHMGWLLVLSRSDPRWYAVKHDPAHQEEEGGLYRDFVHGDEIHPRHFFAKNFACRRQILLDIGLFDERFDGGRGMDDWDLADRLVAAGSRLRFCADAAISVFKPPHRYIPPPFHRDGGNGGIFGRDAGPNLPELPLRILRERGIAT